MTVEYLLRFDGDDARIPANFIETPRIGESIICTMPPSGDVWEAQMFVFTVIKVTRVLDDDNNEKEIQILLADGFRIQP
jgi:hypothetical protein